MHLEPFLHHDHFTLVYQKVTDYLAEIAKCPREKRIKRIKQIFAFDKMFTTDSVQGIAGLVNIDLGQDDTKEKTPIVFKLSVEVNRTVEHEHYILKQLNVMRQWCPNFVGTLGLLNGYVSRAFFEHKDPLKHVPNVFDVKSNGIQTNYLLLEYVNKITFKHICKYTDKTTVTGTLLSVLCALQMAQNKFRFTHYDLHSDNILMREVEPDSYFAYIINNEVVFYPTGGWYPVMIDMGSSYLQGIEARPTRTSISHYHRGLQCTEFDRLGDVHHFILSAMSRLEKCNTQSDDFCRHFRWLSGRMMHFFRKCRIWRHKGWKQLPKNIYFLFNEAVQNVKPALCQLYVELQSSIVETLALGVSLPWKPLDEDEVEQLAKWFYPSLMSSETLFEDLLKHSVQDVCHFLQHLDDDINTKSDIMVVYGLRALVEHACLASASLTTSSTSFTVPRETYQMFRQVTNCMYPQFPHKMDLERSFRGAACLTRLMRHLLYRFNQPNIEEIQKWYSDIELEGPLYTAKFLLKHTGIRYCFKPDSPIYIWDADREHHVKTTFDEVGLKDTNDTNTLIHFSASKSAVKNK